MKYTPGDRVGEWTLLSVLPGKYARLDAGWRAVTPRRWKCQCSCGVIRLVAQCNLASGQSKSCGHGDARVTRHQRQNLRPINSVFALGAST
jgi:hypothetical protein